LPRLLHTADVHLGARHNDLGAAATELRARQLAAFRNSIDLALAERVDAFLVCGDLFDSNSQPRRSVDAAAAELARVTSNGITAVLIPGTHDCYDDGSIYRVFDLAALAGTSPDRLIVLTPDRPTASLPELELTFHARIFPAKRAARSPLAGLHASGPGWHIGLVHGAARDLLPGKATDEVIFSTDEVAASGLDYLALGHWHSFLKGNAGATTWAYSGAPEPLAFDQSGAGNVLLVELAVREGHRVVSVEPRRVGRTRFDRLRLDIAEHGALAALAARIRALADADLVLAVELAGIRPDELDLDLETLERELAADFLRLRVRDLSVPALPEGASAPADTVAGAFVLDLEKRIGEAVGANRMEEAAELREALAIGRQLLDDPRRMELA
jgi:exonuclease SbcD